MRKTKWEKAEEYEEGGSFLAVQSDRAHLQWTTMGPSSGRYSFITLLWKARRGVA